MSTALRSDFAAALNAIANERRIDTSVVIKAIEEAIEAAYRKDQHELTEEDVIEAVVDPLTGEARVFSVKDDKKTDITPPGFGRIAAQTAKQVILQKVREAERSAVIGEYEAKLGTIVNAMVIRFDGKNAIVDLGRGQAMMPPEEQMRGEFYRMNTRMVVYIKEIRDTLRGKTIIVSRAANELVIELFRREVPEVASNAVEIKSIAREPGVRTKIAVFSDQAGVDPVGSCVGQRGVRVQQVIKELNNEKIDIIQFTGDVKAFITAALAPAENLVVEIDEKKNAAVVTVPDDQLSLAIGRGGQNVRLAAKLTKHKITIKSATGQQTTATGEETYEIDQLDLPEEVRTALVEKNYVTFDALNDHMAEVQSLPGVTPELVEKMKQMVELMQSGRKEKEETV